MTLMKACSKGDLAAVKKILAEGADINAVDSSGRTPLIEASWGGHADIVKFLIEKGADINATDKSGFTALCRAAEEGYAPIVSLLVQKGADVNVQGSVRGTTPLMLAAEKGHIKVLEVLVTSGAKVNMVDKYEETPLARAYRTNQTKAAEFLESKGGRGKPERNSYTTSDRESRSSSKASLPQWTAGGFEGSENEDMGMGGEDYDNE